MRRKTYLFLGAALLAVLAGLIYILATKGPEPSFSFYHWKTNYAPGEAEQAMLKDLHSSRQYVRLFDVTVEEGETDLTPIATLRFSTKPELPVVPVIFIQNARLETFLNEATAPDLAQKITGRVDKMMRLNKLVPAKELQLDCDWTESTRSGFFALVGEVKKRLPSGWTLSVTLRLHQYRDYAKTGVPPADRVALMLYNMGNLRTFDSKNSIIDPVIAKQYLRGTYPLPLDVALPLFEWTVMFDKNEDYQGLVGSVPENLDTDTEHFEPIDATHYRLKRPWAFGTGGSTIRVERSTPEDVRAVGALVKDLPGWSGRVIFYHLDAACLKGWSADALRALVR